MKVVKRVAITGTTCLFLGVFLFSSTASATADIDDFMSEGISHPLISKDTRTYRSDNSIPSVEEFMGEGIHFPQAELKRKYSYDTSTPSAQELMSEGIVLSDQPDEMAQKQPTPDLAAQ